MNARRLKVGMTQDTSGRDCAESGLTGEPAAMIACTRSTGCRDQKTPRVRFGLTFRA